MTPTNNALPELPEPEHWYFDGGECLPTDGYTADQMRAYGELCRASAGREAVDLGQFREPVKIWRDNLAGYAATLQKAGRNNAESLKKIDEADRLLALIDAPTAPELPQQGGGDAVGDEVEVLLAKLDRFAEHTRRTSKGGMEAEARAFEEAANMLRALAKKAEGA